MEKLYAIFEVMYRAEPVMMWDGFNTQKAALDYLKKKNTTGLFMVLPYYIKP